MKKKMVIDRKAQAVWIILAVVVIAAIVGAVFLFGGEDSEVGEEKTGTGEEASTGAGILTKWDENDVCTLITKDDFEDVLDTKAIAIQLTGTTRYCAGTKDASSWGAAYNDGGDHLLIVVVKPNSGSEDYSCPSHEDYIEYTLGGMKVCFAAYMGVDSITFVKGTYEVLIDITSFKLSDEEILEKSKEFAEIAIRRMS